MNQKIAIYPPPGHWRRGPNFVMPGTDGKGAAEVWTHPLAGLRVLRSLSTVTGGAHWLHISVSREDRMPSWVEIMKVKNEFIGFDHEAYQVLPAKRDHINVHAFCLHLWTPLDGIRRVANLQDLELEVVP